LALCSPKRIVSTRYLETPAITICSIHHTRPKNSTSASLKTLIAAPTSSCQTGQFVEQPLRDGSQLAGLESAHVGGLPVGRNRDDLRIALEEVEP
jgi:hypothetical protein